MTNFQKVIKYLALAFAFYIIVNVLYGILMGIAGINNIFKTNKVNTNKTEDQYEVFENNNINQNQAENINTLKIDLKYSNLQIKTGDSIKVEKESKYITVSQDENTLKIEEKGDNWFLKEKNDNVTVYIPETLKFDSVDIETGAGDVNIQKLDAQNLKLSIGAGKTEIGNLDVYSSARINGGAGKLSIENGSVQNLQLDLGVGKTEIKSKLTGNNKIDTGIGSLDLDLLDKQENYKFKIDKGIGSVKLNGSNVDDNSQIGSGSNYIKIDGGIGEILIDTIE